MSLFGGFMGTDASNVFIILIFLSITIVLVLIAIRASAGFDKEVSKNIFENVILDDSDDYNIEKMMQLTEEERKERKIEKVLRKLMEQDRQEENDRIIRLLKKMNEGEVKGRGKSSSLL